MALVLAVALGASAPQLRAGEVGEHWRAVTLDNDIFVGEDSGYTNGLYFSGFAVEADEDVLDQLFFSPLRWTLPSGGASDWATAFSLGQALGTPSDISLREPPPGEPPYAALLYYSRSLLQLQQRHADLITTTVGVVGPAALGEPAQRFVHRVTGSSPPMGWDTQIHNEPVFGFTRGRLWRHWVSRGGRADFLTQADVELGTISSSLGGEVWLRYGEGLDVSFATPLLARDRMANPLAVDHGWYVYAGLSLRLMLRHVLLDGNNFRRSGSIEYDPEFVGATIGASYAWRDIAVSFAINDNSVLRASDAPELEKFTRFGSLTVAWQL